MKYTITTDLIKNITPKEIFSVLYPLINDDCIDSIAIDQDMKLLDIYYKNSSNPEYISSWIRLLSETNCYTPIQYSFDSDLFSDKDILIMTSKVIGAKKMIVYSLQSINNYVDEVKIENGNNMAILGDTTVQVIECNTARREINAATRQIQKSNLDESIFSMRSEDFYQKILEAINDTGKSIERYPKTIENQDEETIREHFLTQLSTAFKNCSSTGESYNHTGKTDIMIMHGNDILFIAECKIWKGPKKLNEAICQLLNYLTWRDTKTALLIFNKGTNPQSIVDSIKKTIPDHPNFVKLVKQRDMGWYDYIFHLTDPNEEIKMAVMVFDFK